MDPIQWAKVIAWAATVLCVYFSARGATAFAKNSPRVFTILALFALNWALLVPFYSVQDPSVLLAGFAGFLMVYIGVLLRREAKSPLKTDQAEATENWATTAKDNTNLSVSAKSGNAVDRKDRIALWLLGLLVAPSFLSLPFPPSTIGINRSLTEPVISSVITYFGYYSVVSAIRIYSNRRWGWRLMMAIVVVYALVDAAFTYQLLTSPKLGFQCTADFWRCPPTIMSQTFLYLFAILKILFSTLFIYLVLDESLSDEDRKLLLFDRLLKFVIR